MGRSLAAMNGIRVGRAPSTKAGMGATKYDGGVMFRVWAPHASDVAVVGTLGTDGVELVVPLAPEPGGLWSADLDGVIEGARYKFRVGGANPPQRNDPYAREVTHSAGTSVVTTTDFDWGHHDYRTPSWDDLVIYELHVGTYNDAVGGPPGSFDTVEARLDHLVGLGVSAIELMPTTEFMGDFSWGYNPAQLFAIEGTYGGPRRLKELIRAAHERGLAVFFDVVYNHLGPQDLDLWRFDGWHEGAGGGVYFYNDARGLTPYGETRPDYGRPEVCQYLADNARMWLEEFRVDGLRWDMTALIRNQWGGNNPAGDIPDGWRLMQRVTSDTGARQPWKLHIAEDLQDNDWLTRDVGAGGAGFGSQWDAAFVHPVRRALTADEDADRSPQAVCDAVSHGYPGGWLRRVIYTESHDEVANGRARLPHEITPDDPGSWCARKRSTLGAALVFASPGIPMIFQGQEFLEDEWFRDTDPIDWTKADTYSGILSLYGDLIALRRDRHGTTRGLRGAFVNVHHVNESGKVLAFHRWDAGGPRDDVVVIANLANRSYPDYRVGFPRPGTWRLRCNTDWQGYSPDFGGQASFDTATNDWPRDGLPCSATTGLPPYTALIYSQDS
jgi:1,4-alpha-glucan branching enzyme